MQWKKRKTILGDITRGIHAKYIEQTLLVIPNGYTTLCRQLYISQMHNLKQRKIYNCKNHAY